MWISFTKSSGEKGLSALRSSGKKGMNLWKKII